MSWRLKMKEQRDLRSRGSELLYERVKLLMDVEADPDFTAYCDEQGVEPLDELDNEVAEIAASFATLKEVMRVYPKKSSWTKRLSAMILEIKESQKAARSGKEVERVNWRELAIERQKEIEHLRRDLELANVRIEELRAMVKGAVAAV